MRFFPSSKEIAADFPDLPRWQRLFIRCRFLLAGIYVLSFGGSLIGLGLEWARNGNSRDIIEFAIVGVILCAGQAMLLAGAPQLHGSRPIRRRHKFVSLAIGALAAAGITFGFVATSISLSGKTLTSVPVFGDDVQPWLVFIGVPWLFWLVVFGVMLLNRWTSRFGKMYRLLVAGTCAELLFTIPVDVLVRRRTSCYCDEGTFWALVAGVTTAVWTFGPGVAILFLVVRLRGRKRQGYCINCGYDLRGLPSPRCPECGTAFVAEAIPPST